MQLVAKFLYDIVVGEVKDLSTRLMLKSEKVIKLEEELEMVRADNETLKRLNEQFVKENISLRRDKLLEKRYERLKGENESP